MGFGRRLFVAPSSDHDEGFFVSPENSNAGTTIDTGNIE